MNSLFNVVRLSITCYYFITGHGICLDHFMPKLPLHHVGDCSLESPCGRCIGDCDGDHQCQPGLKCFQRHRFEAIPGCQSGGVQGNRALERISICNPSKGQLI